MDNNMNQRNMNRNNRDIYCDRCFSRCRGILHIVESGDTLYHLGRRYQVSVSDIMRANPYVNVYNLQLGDELCIPMLGGQPNFNLEEEFPISDIPMDRMPMEGMQTPQEFSEEEPIHIVLERLGISMEQFLRCVYESRNNNSNNGMNNSRE